MTFNASFYGAPAPPARAPARAANKADDGAGGVAPGDNGYTGVNDVPPRPQPLIAQIDPQISQIRSQLPGMSGSMTPADCDRMAACVHDVPGMVVADLAKSAPGPGTPVPPVTKAGTSGSETALASNRFASRPGRHPASGQFQTSPVAAGHPTLDQKPEQTSPAGGFPGKQPHTAGYGTSDRALRTRMNQPPSNGPAAEISAALGVGPQVEHVDLGPLPGVRADPSGLAGQFAQPGLNDAPRPRPGYGPSDIPSMRGADAGWPGPLAVAGPGPLAVAIAQHGSRQFGFVPSQCSMGFAD